MFLLIFILIIIRNEKSPSFSDDTKSEDILLIFPWKLSSFVSIDIFYSAFIS